MARIRVLFFASLADAAGRRETYLEVPDGEPVGNIPVRLAEEMPDLASVCVNLALSVNAEYASAGQPLRDGDEVALIPPVSGGSDV